MEGKVNRDEFKGKLTEFRGQLTDDEIAETQGDRDILAGKIQQKYGGSKEQIRRELDDMAA